MHIHIPARFRFLLAFCLVTVIPVIIFIKSNSKPKSDYIHITGKLIYRDSVMGNLPFRDKGSYRYIKIENYQFPFQIYAEKQGASIDSLNVGDVVTVYFYENRFTKESGINNFLQYLEKDNKIYFKRTDFAKNVGYVIIGLLIVSIAFFYVLYKKGKMPY
ncbi:MAG: hypothetical protein JWP94_1762 [Mucilaginibacter sp.]|jgi:hypothetical protein|nr:hypothetical protein [Mucilaginibacter sp.]